MALWAVLAALVAGGAGAQPKLLEPERAFAFSVQALDDRTVEARFAIADGYYLYREKLRFGTEPAILAGVPTLPPGKVKQDEFFGKVETYRGRLAVRLALDAPQPGRQITVRAESQGCADAGVCYPPQVQNITLTLPATGAGPGAPVSAVPTRKSWFN
jgi:thiol:disulfide interchange protein DsbD